MAGETDNMPTRDTLDKCKLDLCTEKIMYRSLRRARAEQLTGKRDLVQQYKICNVMKAEQTHTFYQRLNQYVAAGAVQESTLIQGATKQLDGMNADLAKQFEGMIKKIKDTRDKMNEVMDAACRLERCIEDEERCNPDLFNALGTIKLEGQNFWDTLKEITEHTQTCYQKLNQTFNGSIKIAGILTFVDSASLKPMGDQLVALLALYKKEIEDCIKYSAEQVKAATEELTTTVAEVVTLRYQHCEAAVQFAGVATTYDWMCDPDCADSPLDTLTELCEKVKEASPELDPELEEDCTDPPAKKPRQKQDEWRMDKS